MKLTRGLAPEGEEVLNFIKSLLNPLRITIPFLLDIIIVSDPEQIKKIETSGDVDRLHKYETASLPWWVGFYFKATRFHDDKRDLWFLAFESTSNPSYHPRRAYLEEKVGIGYGEEDVKKIAELLKKKADDEVLAHEMAQIVNWRFFGQEIPLSITKAAKDTLQNLSEAIFPWKYIRAREAHDQVIDYCERTLSRDVNIIDAGHHNIGEVVKTTTGALKTLKDNLDKPVEEIFTSHPLTPQAPRIAVRASTFDGLLSFPTTPGKTVVLFQIGKAAAKTHDIYFTFGTGSPERSCVFKDFFLSYMKDLQKELWKVAPQGPPQSPLTRSIEGIFAIVNRFVRWDELPPWLGILSLAQLRTALREHNLYDTETDASRANPLPLTCPAEFLTNRTPDGSYNDLHYPDMGRTDRRFGRNMPLDRVQRPSDERILTPNPRTIARELMTRDSFKPATTLNILAAGWIQFMIHGWFTHYTTGEVPPFEIPIDDNDDWPSNDRVIRVRRTKVDPSHQGDPTGHPTPYLNRESPWWDGSQIYGRTKEIQQTLRSHQDGKLTVDERGLLPLANDDDKEDQDGDKRGSVDAVDKAGVRDNWWLGLGVMHVLFTLEHNAICDRLKSEYPTWTDDQLFNKARLINAGLLAKIHTVEWTPGILGHPTLQIAMNTNWWGIAGEKIHKIIGRISSNEAISGIPGSPTNHFGVPYSLTEEFVSVYRMHPLVPDLFTFHSVETGKAISEATLDKAVGPGARAIMESIDTSDLFYSLGIANPGAITLRNYPNFLRTLPRRDGRIVDLAAVEILRDRERGVPRYNDFRELLRLPRVKSFSDLTPERELAQEIESLYGGKIDDVDLMVGLFAEEPPKGFGFSDTAFRIFILMASRRLNSDRFFTVDFTPEVYTQVGLDWIANNTMSSVLLRHYPKLGPALRGVKNAFAPWNRI